jgi:hypothetical protein
VTQPSSRGRAISSAVGVFVLVLLVLQVFLLTVAVDALLADDSGLAWVAAACSAMLAAGSVLFARYVRG